MRLASKGGIGFADKQAFRLFRFRKRIRQFLRFRPGQPKTVLFIVGCQRSGTSLLHHLFRLDPNSVTYDEISPLSSLDPKGLRLGPRAEVVRCITADRAPFVVTKPLVESQNLSALLSWFPETRAIWVWRHYGDVALSNIEFFGPDNGNRDLAPILADDPEDWRSQHLEPDARTLLREAWHDGLSPQDAAALFWWARNSLLFSMDGHPDPRVGICRYEDLLADPTTVMRQAYDHVGRRFPGPRIVRDVIPTPRRGQRNIHLDTKVQEMCEEMLTRLDALPRFGRSYGS